MNQQNQCRPEYVPSLLKQHRWRRSIHMDGCHWLSCVPTRGC